MQLCLGDIVSRASGFRFPILGFRVLGCCPGTPPPRACFRISLFNFRFLVFCFQFSVFWYSVSGSRFPVTVSGSRVPGSGLPPWHTPPPRLRSRFGVGIDEAMKSSGTELGSSDPAANASRSRRLTTRLTRRRLTAHDRFEAKPHAYPSPALEQTWHT